MPATVGYARPPKDEDSERLAQARALLAHGRERRRAERQEAWRQSERQYRGDHWSSTNQEDPTADLIVINVSFSTINTIVPYTTSEEPNFLVQPYSLDASLSNARLQQAWLNRQWRRREVRAQKSLETATEDMLLYGDGFLQVSYAIEDRRLPDGGVAEVARLFIDRLSPWNLWMDPAATDLDDARWVASRTRLQKKQLAKLTAVDEDGETFRLVSDEELEFIPSGVDLDEMGERDREAYDVTGFDQQHDWVDVFDFYDTVDRVMMRFVEGMERPLLVVDDIDPPIVQMSNYRIPGSPYHMGELEQIWSVQQELNKSRSQLITHRRRNVVKVFVRENVLADDAREALQSPRIAEFVKIKGNEPLDNIIKIQNLTPLSGEAYNSIDQSLRDIYEITGVNEYLRGATPEIRRTATEASIIEGASNIKTRAKLKKVERGARDAAILMVAIARDIYPLTDWQEEGLLLGGDEADRFNRAAAGEEIAAAIDAGQEPDPNALDGYRGQDVGVRFGPDIWAGEYEIMVETSSTELRNPQFREQKYREMFLAVAAQYPLLAQAGVPLNLRKLLELWFEAAGISDVESLFDPTGAIGGVPPALGQALGGLGAGQPNANAQGAPINPITAATSGAIPPQ